MSKLSGCFLDKTYCASPNCKNACERKPTKELIEYMEKNITRVAFAYFCGEEKDDRTA